MRASPLAWPRPPWPTRFSPTHGLRRTGPCTHGHSLPQRAPSPRARPACTCARMLVIVPARLRVHLVTRKHTENKHELRYCRAPRFGSNIDLKWTRSSAVLHATSISNSTHGPTRHIDLLITNQARAMQTTRPSGRPRTCISPQAARTHARSQLFPLL